MKDKEVLIDIEYHTTLCAGSLLEEGYITEDSDNIAIQEAAKNYVIDKILPELYKFEINTQLK